MQIQVNTDNNIAGRESLAESVQAEVASALSRFEDQITRVEVHLNDENAAKSGGADKSCRLEARPAGRRPVTAMHRATTIAEAVSGAASKMQRVLASELASRSDFKGAESIRPGR